MKKTPITILTIMIVQLAFSQEKMNELSFEYEAVSRGFYMKIRVNKETLVFSEERTGKKDIKIIISNKQWKELIDLANKIKFEELPSFKAPSEKRKVDGAAHAKLKVFINDDEYESSDFDHGNPPLEIKNLVGYIISMSKSIKEM